ncbi:MAG: hypothetical protein U0136_08010 [Bdellovibrionota bacterium]
MKTLSLVESENWIAGTQAGRERLVITDERSVRLAHKNGFSFRIPESTSQRIMLAKLIHALLPKTGETLILVREWSVWKSTEHLPLFYRFRQACGDAHLLIERPGQVLANENVDDITSLCLCGLLFLWDVLIVPDDGSIGIYFSHDEIAYAGATHESSVRDLQRFLDTRHLDYQSFDSIRDTRHVA